MPTLDADANIHLPFPLSEWVITPLPFAPAAINDSDLIVGVQNGQAVQYQNGNVQVLIGADEGSAAVDVSATGVVVGTMGREEDGGIAALWFPLPLRFGQSPVGLFTPAAINRHLTVVGSDLDGNPENAFKWTSSNGFQALPAPPGLTGALRILATDINDNGIVVGVVAAESAVEATPVLWTPDNHGVFRWPQSSTRKPRHVHMNNHGDVVIVDADARRNVTVLHFDGTVESFPSIPEALSVDGISDEGRIIGTSNVNGATRAWTFYKKQLHWLDLPDGTPFQPTGVNTCGNIVGTVSQNSGVLFARPLPFRCDGARVIAHP